MSTPADIAAELRRYTGVYNLVLSCPEFQHKPHPRNDPAWSAESEERRRAAEEENDDAD